MVIQNQNQSQCCCDCNQDSLRRTPEPVIPPIVPIVSVKSVNGYTGDVVLRELKIGEKVYNGTDRVEIDASVFGVGFMTYKGTINSESELAAKQVKPGEAYYYTLEKLMLFAYSEGTAQGCCYRVPCIEKDMGGYALIGNTGSNVAFALDSEDKLNLSLKNAYGTQIAGDTIQLPVRELVNDMNYDEPNKSLVITKKDGSTKSVSISPLVSGLNARISEEATTRATDDAALNLKINNEEIARVAKDTELEGNISTVSAGLTDHTVRVDNPHSVTKVQVGLGDVDNTSDLNKPISTATQTAIDKKVDAVKENGAGKSEIFNEVDGGGVMYTQAIGANRVVSFVGVNDGQDADEIAALIYAKRVNSNVGTRLNITQDKICYNADSTTAIVDDAHELAVKGDIAEYSIVKETTPSGEFAAVYHLTKNGSWCGEAINIAKDLFLKSVAVKECITPDVPIPGLIPGDKYIDFEFETTSGIAHSYIAVKDMVKPYTAGTGIEITADNVIKLNGTYVTTIDTLVTKLDKEIEDRVDADTALETRVQTQLNNKLNILPGDSHTSGNPYNLPYYFYTDTSADKITVHAKTVTLDNNKTYGDYSLDVPTATQTMAGLLSAADKRKIDDSSAGKLSADLTSVFTIGGITAGDTFVAGTSVEDVFKALLHPASHNVTFDANGGSGSMTPAVVYKNQTYALPACSFTPPTEKLFSHWEIAGTRYEVGEIISVTTDLVAKAIWKEAFIDLYYGQFVYSDPSSIPALSDLSKDSSKTEADIKASGYTRAFAMGTTQLNAIFACKKNIPVTDVIQSGFSVFSQWASVDEGDYTKWYSTVGVIGDNTYTFKF